MVTNGLSDLVNNHFNFNPNLLSQCSDLSSDRATRLQRLRWDVGAMLPPELKEKISPQEVRVFHSAPALFLRGNDVFSIFIPIQLLSRTSTLESTARSCRNISATLVVSTSRRLVLAQIFPE